MNEEQQHGGEVIHVRFGPGGGRRSGGSEPGAAEAEPPQPRAASTREPRDGRDEPYTELFTRAEVARLFDIPEGRLRYWGRTGFLTPSAREGRRRYYTFQDLVGVRAARDLLAAGAQLPSVRRGLDKLRGSLPNVTRPLSQLRVRTEGHSLVVEGQEGAFEPETGQLHIDFELRDLRDDVVRVLRQGEVDPERRRKAYEAYLEGCGLDEDEGSFEAAEACYRRALDLDPGLANALTNWGNLRFRSGDRDAAEDLYRRALAIDGEQPEALYNLGFLAFERAEMVDAAAYFGKAAEADPGFADAHFNLAMALEELGQHPAALPHWRTYLELDPDGPWAKIAASHITRV